MNSQILHREYSSDISKAQGLNVKGELQEFPIWTIFCSVYKLAASRVQFEKKVKKVNIQGFSIWI